MEDPIHPPRQSHSSRQRSGASRYSADMPRTPASAGHTSQSGSGRSRQENSDHRSQAAPPQQMQTKKRTSIEMQTGTWSLGKTIGAGSMGKVKIAKNMETGETCAIKIIPRSSTDEHKTAQERERADHSKEIRTAREAAIVTLLNHPYICGMRDFVRTHYHWYMLFEYVNGGQMLDYIISHGRLKEKVAKKFGRQVGSALDYCHRNSIVHRDLKIENILISKAGDIKIIDFGLSNLFSPRSHLKTFCGSLYFAAPELLNAKAYTGPEVDVWSFGIVLYVLVCGKVPFDDQSMPQLHAKIKKGVVEYPSWLTPECKHLLSRMLVTDPKQRITLAEVLNHPWLTKGLGGPPESYLPHREPLQLPLNPAVIEKMHGFDFGSPEHIKRELTRLIESEDYQHAVAMKNKEIANSTFVGDKKKGVFDFYKRRNSISSRDTLQNPSSEALQLGQDPINAYSPLISIYYLAKEKLEREQAEANPGGLKMPPAATTEKPLKISDLPPAPEPAYTNSNSYEMTGEKATGGRARPRARTHGEDEINESMKKTTLKSNPPSPAINQNNLAPPSSKKESMAGGLLRRFSTRRGRESNRDHPPPALQLQPPNESAGLPRKSFSVRRSKNKESPMLRSTGSQPNREDLLSPPFTDSGVSKSGSRSRMLNRSASVNSGTLRRRRAAQDENETPVATPGDPPPTSGSDRSSLIATPRVKISEPESAESKPQAPKSATMRTKSLGHARRESIQARRSKRSGKQTQIPEDTDIGEETEGESQNEIKPVFLKGLFSVSTTSSKPLPVIRNDIIRVLRQLGVEYTEIKAGFSCRHAPSIDLKTVAEPSPASPENQQFVSPSHRRRISFGVFGNRDSERDEVRDLDKSAPLPLSARRKGDSAVSDESDNDIDTRRRRDRPAGETTTHVDNDLGENLVLHFEILLVKVPFLGLHGIQFKKVAGGTWQYKNMAQKILDALRL